ncbi:MAG: hypothetical protein MJA31_13605 [Clostridia bacterium]|nr:hypothetical protein [Clostridia bacterium]
MKKIVSIVIIVLMMFNLSLLIGFAQNVDFTYEENIFEGIEIINPDQDTIYSDYLLISIKIKENIDCNFSLLTNVDKEKRDEIEVLSVTSNSAVSLTSDENEDSVEENNVLYGPEKIDQSDQFQFYTIQLENLVPGQYEIKIQVVDDQETVTDTVSKVFNIEEKSMMPEETVDEDIFEDKEDTGIDVIHDFIKSIFGD